MGLPWVRLDTNIFSHDKVLWLLAQRDGWRAFGVYTFAMAYAGGHGTDGFIAKHVLAAIHGTPKIAESLVEAGLWEYAEGGYQIRNWGERQEMTLVAELKRQNKRIAGAKSQCVQRHGPTCNCWKDAHAV